LGIGDWGLERGEKAQSTKPNNQYPKPKHQTPKKKNNKKKKKKNKKKKKKKIILTFILDGFAANK